MKLINLYLLLVLNTICFAQVDTTDWYPLHIGDKWEYYGQGFGYSQVEVIGDTLMPNGKTYYIFSDGVYAWRFQRKENNDIVYGYNYTNNTDYILFNFVAEEKSLWSVPFDNYWGIFEINIDNQNLLNTELQYRIFERAMIDSTINPPDTIWGYIIDAYPTRITKGFGVDSYMYNLETLVGAVINGVGYGTLVDVEEAINKSIPNSFNIYQNYPNPFNPSTTIKYSVPGNEKRETKNVKLTVYDVLGNEVATLVNEQKPEGNYEVKFDGSRLSSGIYFYQLKSGNFSETKKMILMK